jgi:transcriptional regulator with XRE-family HTH domain
MFTEERAFGQRLRTARVHAGLSQSGLESRSGIPKARLSRYENGHVLPSIDTLGRLAAALGVSEASLLGDQRAIVEEFFAVLFRRGVRIYSLEQAGRLANAVADILTLASPPVDGSEQPADVANALMGTVTPTALGAGREQLAGVAGEQHPSPPI